MVVNHIIPTLLLFLLIKKYERLNKIIIIIIIIQQYSSISITAQALYNFSIEY